MQRIAWLPKEEAMNKNTCVFTFLLFFLLALFVQAGETILIKNGTIVTVVGNRIQKGSILIEDGKITKDAKPRASKQHEIESTPVRTKSKSKSKKIKVTALSS